MIEEMFAGFDSEDLEAAMQAERDVLGTRAVGYVMQRNDEVVERACEGMKAALQNLPSKKAYDEAVARNARVVECETPFQTFLLASNYNYWEAAEKLAAYWESRKEIFGERFCLPMVLSTESPSVLEPEVVKAIKCGASFEVKNDKYNRSVILVDQEIASPEWLDPKNRIKLFFYLLHSLMESDLAVRNGFVGVSALNMKSGQKVKPDRRSMNLLLSETIPIKFRACHLLAFKKASLVHHTCNAMLTFFKNWKYIPYRVRLHVADSKEQILKALDQFGLCKGHVPKRYGGTADFENWWSHRLEVERKRYAAQPTLIEGHSKDIEEDIRGKLKRTLDEVQEYNQKSMEQRKKAKLDIEIKSLCKKREMKLETSAFLKTLRLVVDHIAKQYEHDTNQILSSLAVLAGILPGIPSAIASSDERKQHFAKSMFERYIIFCGRGGDGCWMFACKEGLTLEEQHFSRVLQQCLLSDQKLQSCSQGASDSDLDDAMTGTEDIRSLQAEIQRLENRKIRLEQNEAFLEAAEACCRFLGERFDSFVDENVDYVASIYGSLFTSITGASPSALRGSFAPKVVAKQLLDEYTTFDGLKYTNPVMSNGDDIKLSVPPDLQEQLDSSKRASPQVLEWFLSVFGAGISREHRMAQQIETLHNQAARAVFEKQEADKEERLQEARRLYRQQRKKWLKRL